MILCSFLNELDSYNSMNAAHKGHHAVHTAHASSGKKYCLLAFDEDANKVWSLLLVVYGYICKSFLSKHVHEARAW
jgi:hypothetical protein